MEEYIVAALRESKTPLRSIDIVSQLKEKKDITTTKSAVNKLLYSKSSTFCKEGDKPPKWKLTPNATALPSIWSNNVRIFLAESLISDHIEGSSSEKKDIDSLLNDLIATLIKNGFSELEFDENVIGKKAKCIYQSLAPRGAAKDDPVKPASTED